MADTLRTTGSESIAFKSAKTSAGNLNAQEIADATSLAIRGGDSQVSGAATGFRLKFTRANAGLVAEAADVYGLIQLLRTSAFKRFGSHGVTKARRRLQEWIPCGLQTSLLSFSVTLCLGEGPFLPIERGKSWSQAVKRSRDLCVPS